MIQLLLYCIYFPITLLLLLYGLYEFFLPGIAARISLTRLGYRLIMAILRRPAKPIKPWRKRWLRIEGAFCLLITTIWLVNLHPQVRFLPSPLYDPSSHHWQADHGDGSQEETNTLQQLDAVTRDMLKAMQIGYHGWLKITSDVPVGMCMGAVQGNRTYLLSIGRKNIDRLEPPDANTEFEIGSITKTFTCTALASLVDEGVVRLDEPLAELLPGWTIPEYHGRKITLNDLATHRSGLPRMPDAPMKGAIMDGLLGRALRNPYRNGTPEFVKGFLAEYALPREPGASDEYSNLGMGLLGCALATKSQQPYELMIRQRVLDPLEMTDTGVHPNTEQAARFAQGYIGPLKLGRIDIAFPMIRWTIAEGFQGCGSISSTVNDMLKYVRANIAAPEGPAGKALARIQAPQFDVPDIKDGKIGLAMFSMPIKGLDDPIYWHNGGTGGYNSYLAFSKKYRVGVIILATGVCPEDLGEAVIKTLAANGNT